MKNAMKSEYPELKDNAHHRLVFYSPEEEVGRLFRTCIFENYEIIKGIHDDFAWLTNQKVRENA